MEPKWISDNITPAFDEDIIEIPCILGASYAFTKKYWQQLFGLDGLRYYGSDEAFISLKAWLSGGSCKLIKSVVIGHIFREVAPYRTMHSDVFYNKLLIAELLFDAVEKKRIFDLLKKASPDMFSQSMFLLEMQEDEVAGLKEALQPILRKDLAYFQERVNQYFQKCNEKVNV